jgi:hypothetical protein
MHEPMLLLQLILDRDLQLSATLKETEQLSPEQDAKGL